MKIDLHVFNPTDFIRKQWVLYGSTEPHNVFRRLPNSYLNVAYVEVGPGTSDQLITVDIADGPDKGAGYLSSTVAKTLKDHKLSGFRPFLMINDTKHYFHFSYVTVATHDYSIAVWLLKGDGIVARLWTYYGRQDNLMRFEMSYYCESLDALRKHFKISMGVDAKNVLITSRGKDYTHLMDDWMLDGQGNRLLGSFIFYSDFTQDSILTLLAESRYPLYALHEWDRWGPWQKKPVSISNAEFDRQTNNKASQRWQDPLTFPGYILNRRPGDTGAQAGFGTWQHVPTVGASRSEQMALDQYIVGQEACRPTHFFEKSGFALMADRHPNFVPWDERVHWSKVVSPDRLRRTYRGNLHSSSDWFGHDRQHFGALWLAEDVILNGSAASDWELWTKSSLLQEGLTLPSEKPGWSTNNGLAGRDGRMMLSAVYIWMATGDKQLIRHMAKRFNEKMRKRFTKERSPGPLHTSRVICGDNRVFGKQCGWIVWEDALMAMGLDALALAFAQEGYTDEAIEADRIASMLAKTVTDYGWHPTRNIIAKAILWRGPKTPPLTAAQWDDEKFVLLANGTDYDKWALPCLEIATRNGSQRAWDLIWTLKLDNDNPIHHVYMGTK